MAISTVQHPIFSQYRGEWLRYRDTWEGGRRFVDRYLKKYHVREEQTDFDDRKELTYCPGFASSAVDEINNAIFSRMPDVARVTTSDSYNKSIEGELNGVDYSGSSIDSFIGCEVLPELTYLGRVGVYVDMPRAVPGVRSVDNEVHPYYYIYRAEDIRSWTFGEPGSGHEFTRLLLRDNYFKYDENTSFISGSGFRYREIKVVSNGIEVTFWENDKPISEPVLLDLEKIPFVLFDLKHSLLKDVADYQIALMNIESTDVDYARKVNFPIFTQQTNFIQNLPNNKPEGQEATTEPVSDTKSLNIGTKHGINYGKTLDRPGFISPSSDPLRVNMEKESEMKRDIRLLVHLNVASLGNKTVSRESKDFDREGLENGLSLISLVLEEGERKLATFWLAYENNNTSVKISYPRNFDLRTDEDRRQEAQNILDSASKIQSDTFKREMIKRAVTILLGNKVSNSVLVTMHKEIDDAPTTTSDPKVILADFEAGLLSPQTASVIRGYPKEEYAKAKEAHKERLANIAAAQGGEVGIDRGNPDFDEKEGKPKREDQKLPTEDE